MTRQTATSVPFKNASTRSDCLELAREALSCARAFRRSVADFDNINVSAIFGELNNMRSTVQS